VNLISNEGIPEIMLTQLPYEVTFSGEITSDMASHFRRKWQQHKERSLDLSNIQTKIRNNSNNQDSGLSENIHPDEDLLVINRTLNNGININLYSISNNYNDIVFINKSDLCVIGNSEGESSAKIKLKTRQWYLRRELDEIKNYLKPQQLTRLRKRYDIDTSHLVNFYKITQESVTYIQTNIT
jgi:hypothetical protein